MSACVHAVAAVTHLHIHNTHKHAHTRFMHGTVLDPVKASGASSDARLLCFMFELHCLN